MKSIIMCAAICSLTGLVSAGSISGRVTRSSDGAGVEYVSIYFYDFHSNLYRGWAEPDSEGYYVAARLAAGTYRVELCDDWNYTYTTQYYDGVYAWSEATPVVVGSGEDVSGVDFVVRAVDCISGRVTRASDGTGIGGVYVCAYDFTSRSWGGSAYTDGSGYYVIGNLVSGTYYVEAYDYGGQFLYQYYDGVYTWEEAAPVSVVSGEETSGVDFSLHKGGSISGRVTRESDGEAIPYIRVEAIDRQSGWIYTCSADMDGYYTIVLLHSGDYDVRVSARETNYAGKWYDNVYRRSEATAVHVEAGEETEGINFALGEGLRVEGKVADKETGLPVQGILVGVWHDDTQMWRDTLTDVNGEYTLMGLVPGGVWVSVQPWDSDYARLGRDVELVSDLYGLDFVLPKGATLSGRVVHVETGEPLEAVSIEYWNGRHRIWDSEMSGSDGSFTLRNLPPGMAELGIKSYEYPRYVWLAWPANLIYLDEGQAAGGRVIAVREGVCVRGYVKDAEGRGVAGVEVEFSGRLYEDWTETDGHGRYKAYLSAGDYTIGLDFDADDPVSHQWAARPVHVTVGDEGDVEAPDIIAYSYATGGRISGTVVCFGDWGMRRPWVTVLEAGTPVTPETFATVRSVCDAEPSETGQFVIPILPPGSYDIYLAAEYEDDDGAESFLICDLTASVPVGSEGLVLNGSLGTGIFNGRVVNAGGAPVPGAYIFIGDASTGTFAGGIDTGSGGNYVVENMPAGTYGLTAMHLKYGMQEKVIAVTEGLTTGVEDFVLPFAGGKEASDLNGDGIIDVEDLAMFAEQWLEGGEADMNKSGAVNLADLARMADLWQWQAMWTLTGGAR